MQDETYETRPRSELPSRCSNCRSTLAADEWHPTESVMRDGEVRTVHVFCDEECRVVWEQRRPCQASG